jgi:Zn-dependent peptidase ImmA (M78 family)
MHEFVHIILGETVIDIPDEFLVNRDNLERGCNAFSAPFLLPKESVCELFKEYQGRFHIHPHRKSSGFLAQMIVNPLPVDQDSPLECPFMAIILAIKNLVLVFRKQ